MNNKTPRYKCVQETGGRNIQDVTYDTIFGPTVLTKTVAPA